MSLFPRIVLSAVLLAGVATTASAQPMPRGGPEDIQMDGHGLQVFFSPSGQPFRAKPGEPYPVAAWFAQADKDHDGKLSRDEFTNDAVNFFRMLDRNRDNYISSPENTFYETEVAPEITRVDPRIDQPTNFHNDDTDDSVDKDPTLGRYQKSIQGASQYGLIDEPQPIRGADANYDFRISMDEWVNATAQRFNVLDVNGDGFITLDELPKTPAQRALESPKKGPGAKKKRFGW
ncbi:hypothetical protein [Asticcacaulis solisilvae]|uniref:hypothetical protein n=1 Tax=Asticcacaulis solisilvae TaxID=1217274 RepID=UPI003FD79D39